jgi:hypothetical protein
VGGRLLVSRGTRRIEQVAKRARDRHRLRIEAAPPIVEEDESDALGEPVVLARERGGSPRAEPVTPDRARDSPLTRSTETREGLFFALQ